jgi:hypothetical protein
MTGACVGEGLRGNGNYDAKHNRWKGCKYRILHEILSDRPAAWAGYLQYRPIMSGIFTKNKT